MTKLEINKWLKKCDFCPHECKVDRFASEKGYCNTDACYNVASITLHKGEEPAIGGPVGICNVFFYHCNMQCVYCQNYQISRNGSKVAGKPYDFDGIYSKIVECLNKKGTKRVGFVSPSHNVPQMVALASKLKDEIKDVIVVYNTNSYEKAEVIEKVAKVTDIFLPDLKYYDDNLGVKYSKVKNYFAYASGALATMLKLKPGPVFDEDGYMLSGVVLRHLILRDYLLKQCFTRQDILL
jgi:putative pyruvate formate lyase activating enzyme